MQCEVLPLKTVKELVEWTAPCSNFKVEKLKKRKPVKESRQKTLICHDMKGGYLEDRWVHGARDAKPYRFYHWYLIDTFVYFSHYFVTIPPIGWINASHRNGVHILGTFITEWKDGFEKCEEFLNSTDMIYEVAEKLTSIAKFYNFDGWLINIENRIKPENIPKVIKFLKILSKMIHLVKPWSMVIWYDSVVCSGELKWQNELNAYNRCFFDACDGFFVNYTWTEDHLKNTAKAAGDRIADVYVGIDVFGRNCFGGGGFNTRAAMAEARKHNLSAAIFANGWVYECLGSDDFEQNEQKFWTKLVDLCNYNAFTELPLKTSFCQGLGERVYYQGGSKMTKVCYDMNFQQVQPVFNYKVPPNCCMEVFNKDAFIGRSSLKLEGRFLEGALSADFLLFFTHYKITGTNPNLLQLSYTYKNLNAPVPNGTSSHEGPPYLLLNVCTDDGDNLLSFPQEEEISESDEGHYYTLVESRDSETSGWVTRTFKVIPSAIKQMFDGKDALINEVHFRVCPSSSTRGQEKPFSVLLGYFSLELLDDSTMLMKSFRYQVINVEKILEHDTLQLSCYMEWESPVDADFWTLEWTCSRDLCKSYCATTSQTFFHMSDFKFLDTDLDVSDGYYAIPLMVKAHFVDISQVSGCHEVLIKVPVHQ